jgi:low affinity Fe/Cu permease
MARDGYAQEVKIIQSLGMRIKTHMECIVCKNLERDTNDIQRKIDELRSDLRKIKTASEKEYIAFEMSALGASKSEIEGRYLKHRKSSPHQTVPDKTRGHLSFS